MLEDYEVNYIIDNLRENYDELYYLYSFLPNDSHAAKQLKNELELIKNIIKKLEKTLDKQD